MKRLFNRPYIYYILVIFLAYLVVAFVISGFYNTLPLVIRYAQTVNWVELGLSLLFSGVIGFLVAINVVAVHIKHKERKACKEAGTVATLGTVSGLAAGICPLCVTGLFPLVLGLFGITFSFASLPFKGLEIQLASIFLLGLSLVILFRKNHS